MNDLFPLLLRRLGTSAVRFSDGRAYFREALDVDRRNLQDNAQRKYLIRLLRHCREHVPYYRELMRQFPLGWEKEPIAYLQTLPILTKGVVRQKFDELKSDDLARRKWVVNTSGGSTGEPVRFIQDRQYHRHLAALTDIHYLWLNHRPGDRMVMLWGSERDILGGKATWRERVFSFLYNQTVLNAFLMTPARMGQFVDIINHVRPTLLLAYAQAAYEFAGFIEEQKLEIRPPGAIMTSAGTLHDFMRERIEQVFRCPVANRYGSREISDIASQCREGGHLHVSATGCYVEIVDEAGRPLPPGTEGNIVVTGLANLAMPLVRYFIGDRGSLSTDQVCVCGRRGQMLDRVTGRTVDAFRRADGTLIDGEYFTHLLYFRSWVRKFQIVQKKCDHIAYSIVGEEPPQTELDELTEKTRAVMGSSCQVTFGFVPEIREGASGKYRYTISEVSEPHDVHTG